jgi:hypothetical protein
MGKSPPRSKAAAKNFLIAGKRDKKYLPAVVKAKIYFLRNLYTILQKM